MRTLPAWHREAAGGRGRRGDAAAHTDVAAGFLATRLIQVGPSWLSQGPPGEPLGHPPWRLGYSPRSSVAKNRERSCSRQPSASASLPGGAPSSQSSP